MHRHLFPTVAAAILICALTGCEGPGTDAGPVVPSASGSAASGTPDQPALDAYRLQANHVLDALADSGDTRDAAARATDLMHQGAALVPGFVQRHPHCAPYLEAALAVVEGWQRMDLATIESDYHDDGALPEIEDAAVCYHLKDLFVHPATVLVILASDEPDLAQARHEIQEVQAHATVVEASLR